MTVDEVKILLSDLNRGYNTPYSSAEQATIERLYYEVLGKRLSGCRCPDRWHDAVLEINSYIKKHGKKNRITNCVQGLFCKSQGLRKFTRTTI